jgi:hypothetical protein
MWSWLAASLSLCFLSRRRLFLREVLLDVPRD